MKKPPWLKKADLNKPWKYKYTVQEGEYKGLVIEPYNFNTPIGMDTNEIEKACDWIDKKMEKQEDIAFKEEIRRQYPKIFEERRRDIIESSKYDLTIGSEWQPKGHKTEWKVQTFNEEDVWLYRVDIPNPGWMTKIIKRETLIEYYRRIR